MPINNKLTFPIEKNVPVPQNRYPFDAMEPGDSFLVPKDQVPASGTTAILRAVPRRHKDKKWACRTLPNGDARIWRLM